MKQDHLPASLPAVAWLGAQDQDLGLKETWVQVLPPLPPHPQMRYLHVIENLLCLGLISVKF
jgi:hypothetical protein